jgi:hypothetical protein
MLPETSKKIDVADALGDCCCPPPEMRLGTTTPWGRHAKAGAGMNGATKEPAASVRNDLRNGIRQHPDETTMKLV